MLGFTIQADHGDGFKSRSLSILSLVNVASILLLSVFVLDVPVNGSVLLLFAESTLFIITCLTLGIFISVKTNSQQVAMLISLMGMLLPTILFSGFMFPIENMPVAVADNFQYCSRKMVLHYCKIHHDQRPWIFWHMERNTYPVWHNPLFIISQFKKF